MKTITILTTLALSVIIAKAQTNNNATNNHVATSTVIFSDTTTIEERQPSFPGGTEELSKFLKNNVNYNGGDKGQVVASFIIEKDGSLSDIKITKSLSSASDKAVLKAIKKMPNWLPGMLHGHVFRTRYSLPVNF